jgi:hypothetical protein
VRKQHQGILYVDPVARIDADPANLANKPLEVYVKNAKAILLATAILATAMNSSWGEESPQIGSITEGWIEINITSERESEMQPSVESELRTFLERTCNCPPGIRITRLWKQARGQRLLVLFRLPEEGSIRYTVETGHVSRTESREATEATTFGLAVASENGNGFMNLYDLYFDEKIMDFFLKKIS